MVTHTSLTSNKHKLYINAMNQLCTIINYIQNISFHNKSKKKIKIHTRQKKIKFDGKFDFFWRQKKSNSIHTNLEN